MMSFSVSAPSVNPTSVIFALLSASALFAAVLLRRRRRSNISYLPCPDGARKIWGHELDVFLSPVGSKYIEWFNRYGSVFRMKGSLLCSDIVVVADRAAIHHLLTTNVYNYTKLHVTLVERLVGKGIVASEGSLHKRFRRLMDSTFSPANVRVMAPTVLDATNSLRSRLTQYLQENNGEAITNIMPWIAAASIDIIGHVAFGYDFEGGQSPAAKGITTWWEKQTAMATSTAAFYADAVLRSFPFLTSIPVGSMQAQGQIKIIVNEIAQGMLRTRTYGGALTEKGGSMNFLDMMSEALDNKQLTWEEIIDNISNLIVAGYETTASSVSMHLLELSKRPECQKLLREELASLGREPTYEDFMVSGKLPYLDAVIKEGLRLNPLAAESGRIAVADDVIPLDMPVVTTSGEIVKELQIRKGQIIHMPQIAIHRLESVWEDANCYRPERWLEPGKLPSRDKTQIGWSHTLAFSSGPRTCLGYRLALLESKALLSMFIRNFIFETVPGTEIETTFAVVLQPLVVGKKGEGAQLPLRISFAQ